MDQKTIIVTGCAGFVGSHLTETLLFEGHTVYGVDNLSTGSRANMAKFIDHHNFHFFDVDLSIQQHVANLMLEIDDIDFFYHLAARGSVPYSIKWPGRSFQNNVVMTQNCLDMALSYGVEQFVYASSSSVYGDQEGLKKVEYMDLDPQSPYALFKHMGEQLCRMYTKTTGLPTVAFRFFNVFGPHQLIGSEYSAVVPKLCHSLIHNTPFEVYGDGNQKRDFTFVDDVVSILYQVLETAPRHLEYNIGADHPISVNDIIKILEKHTGQKVRRVDCPPRPGDIRNSHADITRIKTEYDFEHILTGAWCFAQTYDHYKKQQEEINVSRCETPNPQ